MELTTFLPWALTTGAITLGAWAGIVLHQRDARRRLAAEAARARELEAARRAVADLESRAEFAERLLRNEGKPPGPER